MQVLSPKRVKICIHSSRKTCTDKNLARQKKASSQHQHMANAHMAKCAAHLKAVRPEEAVLLCETPHQRNRLPRRLGPAGGGGGARPPNHNLLTFLGGVTFGNDENATKKAKTIWRFAPGHLVRLSCPLPDPALWAPAHCLELVLRAPFTPPW